MNDSTSQSPEPNARPPRFPALRHRDYRYLWIGQSFSSCGSMMQTTALHWHLYSLTHDPLSLGLIGLCRFIPIITFSLIGGAVADAMDRRRIMIASQIAMMCISSALCFLTVTDQISPGAIYALVACSAAAIAFDNPARQSLFANLVPREDYPNAASLNSISFRTATIVGPAIAGILIESGGLRVAYGFNAVSYLAVIYALMSIRSKRTLDFDSKPEVSLKALKEGLRFVLKTPILVSTMVLDFVATFFSSADTLLPVFASTILHVGGRGYGWLVAAQAVGALLFGAIIALRPTIHRQGLAITGSILVYGCATVVFGLSSNYWLSWMALACIGAADTVSTVVRQTVRQLVTPNELRGRMVSINMVFFMGGPQLGELEAGLVARFWGAPASVVSGGIACVGFVLLAMRRWPWLMRYTSTSQQPNAGE